MNLKQLFCNHVWETITEKYLRSIRRSDWMFPSLVYVDFDVYAQYQKCLKCEKSRIIENRKLDE